MTSRQPGALPPGTTGHYWLRLLPLALLIILGLAGLRGAVATPRWDGPLHRDGVAVGIALEVVLLILLLITVRRIESGDQEAAARKLRGVLLFALGAGVVAVAVATLVGLHLHLFTPVSKRARGPAAPTATPWRPALRPGSAPGSVFHIPLAERAVRPAHRGAAGRAGGHASPPACWGRAASYGRPCRRYTREPRTSRCSSRSSGWRQARCGSRSPRSRCRKLLPAARGAARLAQLPGDPPPGAVEEGALLAVLWLEVLHPSRPWRDRGPRCRAHRLPARRASAEVRCLPRAPTAGPGAGRRRGPARLGAGAGMLQGQPGKARRCCARRRRARFSPRRSRPAVRHATRRGPRITQGRPPPLATPSVRPRACRDLQREAQDAQVFLGLGLTTGLVRREDGALRGLIGGQDPMAEIVRPGLSSGAGPGRGIDDHGGGGPHPDGGLGRRWWCTSRSSSTGRTSARCRTPTTTPTPRRSHGPTTRLLQDVARQHGIVIIAPMYEEEHPGVYYDAAAVIDADGATWAYRKTHLRRVRASGRSSISGRATSATRCSDTAAGRIGVYICYDRHFPEGWRALGLASARIVFDPSTTSRGLSQYLWRLGPPTSAVADEYFIGAVDRVGVEPLGDNDFYGETSSWIRAGNSSATPRPTDKGARWWCATWTWSSWPSRGPCGRSTGTAGPTPTGRWCSHEHPSLVAARW